MLSGPGEQVDETGIQGEEKPPVVFPLTPVLNEHLTGSSRKEPITKPLLCRGLAGKGNKLTEGITRSNSRELGRGGRTRTPPPIPGDR